jgi:hypothetical protein
MSEALRRRSAFRSSTRWHRNFRASDFLARMKARPGCIVATLSVEQCPQQALVCEPSCLGMEISGAQLQGRHRPPAVALPRTQPDPGDLTHQRMHGSHCSCCATRPEMGWFHCHVPQKCQHLSGLLHRTALLENHNLKWYDNWALQQLPEDGIAREAHHVHGAYTCPHHAECHTHNGSRDFTCHGQWS